MALELLFKDKTKEELIKELKLLRARIAVLQEAELAQQKAERETSLLKSIIISISEAEDLSSALKIVLQNICETTVWIYGQAWIPDTKKNYLECTTAR